MRGRKFEPIRWTIEHASREFGLDKKTLSGRLKREGILPGTDGHWSTKQIVSAIHGDLESERIRKTRAEADQIEKENRKMDGELVDLDDLKIIFGKITASMVSVIMASKLSESEKDALRESLAKFVSPKGKPSQPRIPSTI